MRVRSVAFRQVAIGGKGAAALLLALCCTPALASSGVEDLAIDVADPGSVAAVQLTPRIASILREIFDETVPEEQDVENATPVNPPSAAPLAELIAPDLREKSRSIDAADIRKSESDLTRVKTNVSGVSEDELSRFRRQMFRTDI